MAERPDVCCAWCIALAVLPGSPNPYPFAKEMAENWRQGLIQALSAEVKSAKEKGKNVSRKSTHYLN